MKKLKKIYYFIVFHFGFAFLKNYKTNLQLDILLIYLNDIGIKSISVNLYYMITIIFNDGTKFEFWNENRWYAWMKRGNINFSNGKELTWDNVMPSNEVLVKYGNIIKKSEKKETDFNFDQYLPIKTLRKNKLKKLNSVK